MRIGDREIKILPGDALQYFRSYGNWNLINHFTRSIYYHTALVLGAFPDYSRNTIMLDIVEARVLTGVKRKTITLNLKKFHVYRHDLMLDSDRMKLAQISEKYLGMEYDINAVLYRWWMLVTFQPHWCRNVWDVKSKQYCSELYARILSEVGLRLRPGYPLANVVPADISDSKMMKRIY